MTMVTKKHVPAGQFKAQCLALLDEVAATGRPLIVTKRGRPVAEVVPIEPPRSLAGTVKILVSEEELIAPLEDWDVES
jgi:prevent-host-death family protein